MIIAIPSVTKYISSSRKDAYVWYIDGTTNKVNNLEFDATLNKKGYRIIAYDKSSQHYIENETGSMIYTSGYCCVRHSVFLVFDSENNIVHAARYSFSIPWSAC